MADKKITQLTDGGAPQATDEFVIARAGDNFKVDYAAVETEVRSDVVVDGDAAGGVLGGTYPNPGFAVDMATQSELDAHINDPTDAHDGSAISNVPAGTIAATDVQAALNELDTEKVAAALVVLKSLYDANTILAATTDDTPAALTMGASTILARLAAGDIVAATPSQLRTLLALVIGTDIQAFDATLAALAAANWAANALPIGTGADTLSQTTFAANTFPARASTGNLVAKTITDFGLSLVDDADAATALTTLGAAPSSASFVTTAAESGLSAEKVLGTSVIMSGTLGSRPAAATAGLLYLATDVNGGTLYRDTGAAWVQVGPGVRYDAFNGQAGVLVPTMKGWSTGTGTAFTNGRVGLTRFVLPCDFTVTSMKFRSIGAGTGNVDVGIYDTSSNLLASSGATAGKKGATTTQTLNLTATVALTAGTVYYAAIVSSANDGTFLQVNANNGFDQLFGTTIGLADLMYRDTTIPLPNPIGALTANNTLSPVMVLI